MTAPRRIQLRRTAGWRKPEGAVVVARPSKWGNPYVVHEHTAKCGDDLDQCPVWAHPDANRQPIGTALGAYNKFRHAYLYPCIGDAAVPDVDEIREHLRGKDLACWCPLDQPCHADVLLEIANGGAE